MRLRRGLHIPVLGDAGNRQKAWQVNAWSSWLVQHYTSYPTKTFRKACLHVLVLRNTGSRQKAQEMDSPLWLVCKVSLVIG